MKRKVIELIRVSTEQQAADDRASIPAQRAVNRQTCARYNLEIVKTIEFSDVSGANVLAAPEMQELLRLIEAPDIYGVVTREFSRLMRPERWTDLALLQSFIDTNTMLYTESGEIDLDSDNGRMVGGMSAIMAGIERRQIVQRSWAAKESKRRRGELAQSQIVLPFGVGYEAGRWFYKPESELVREAFRRFLAGEQNYNELAKLIGVTPRGAHIILRNPIYSGWRVIDKKRDRSGAGKYKGKDGRQSDRKKIARSPEDVIRLKVIDEPLISETEFQTVQRIMDIKQDKHWRSNPEFIPAFTYNGFLVCSACGELIYTYTNRRQSPYYVCKAKQYSKSTGHKCATTYMRRDQLEDNLDALLSTRLTDPGFLREVADDQKRRCETAETQSKILRLQGEIQLLRGRRQRVLDTFFEGAINREERDSHLQIIERNLRVSEELLMSTEPPRGLSIEELTMVFEPFFDWAFLNRSQKRQLLSTFAPEIRVADYKVSGLLVTPALACHNDNTHMGRDSSPPRA